MDYGSIFEISASGMDFQRARLEVIAMNMANANTSRAENGALYKAMEVVASNGNDGVFPGQLDGVNSITKVARAEGSKWVFDPSHPHANPKGYVEMPNINPIDEMTNLMLATRAYEANVRVLNAAKTMALRALQIGE